MRLELFNASEYSGYMDGMQHMLTKKIKCEQCGTTHTTQILLKKDGGQLEVSLLRTPKNPKEKKRIYYSYQNTRLLKSNGYLIEEYRNGLTEIAIYDGWYMKLSKHAYLNTTGTKYTIKSSSYCPTCIAQKVLNDVNVSELEDNNFFVKDVYSHYDDIPFKGELHRIPKLIPNWAAVSTREPEALFVNEEYKELKRWVKNQQYNKFSELPGLHNMIRAGNQVWYVPSEEFNGLLHPEDCVAEEWGDVDPLRRRENAPSRRYMIASVGHLVTKNTITNVNTLGFTFNNCGYYSDRYFVKVEGDNLYGGISDRESVGVFNARGVRFTLVEDTTEDSSYNDYLIGRANVFIEKAGYKGIRIGEPYFPRFDNPMRRDIERDMNNTAMNRIMNTSAPIVVKNVMKAYFNDEKKIIYENGIHCYVNTMQLIRGEGLQTFQELKDHIVSIRRGEAQTDTQRIVFEAFTTPREPVSASPSPQPTERRTVIVSGPFGFLEVF